MNEGFPSSKGSNEHEAVSEPAPEMLELIRSQAGVGKDATPSQIARAFMERSKSEGVDPIDTLPSGLTRQEEKDIIQWAEAA